METKQYSYPDLDKLPSLRDEHYKFLYSRKLTDDSIRKGYVFPARAYFRELGREGPAIAFPYIRGGKIYSVKLRSIEGKYFTSRGSRSSLYLDWLLPAGPGECERVVLVEGELDALAVLSSGVDGVVSLPNGASSVPLGGPLPTLGSPTVQDRFHDDNPAETPWLGDLRQRLSASGRVILAGDADEPGIAVQDEISRRFGYARCHRVTWGAGRKDAGDVVVNEGDAAIVEAIANAVPEPVVGLVEATAYATQLEQLYRGELAQGLDIGLGTDADQLFSVPFGFLTVVTGWPNDGKSQLVDNIIVHLAQKHGVKTAIWSPENSPEIHIAKLMEIRHGWPFFGNGATPRMSLAEVGSQLEWVNEHFFFLNDVDGLESSIDSILSRLEAAILRYGIRVAVIDPYNHIAKPANEENEVEWIRKLLIRIKRFAQSHGLHIFLVAHPRQLPSGSKRFPPTGFHISGGAPWNAITDFGLTVYRPKVETDVDGIPPSEAQLVMWKVRHKWHGRRGVADLEFDSSCGRYYQQIIPASPVRRGWSDLDDI